MAMKQDVDNRRAVVAVKEDDLKAVEAERARLHEQSIKLKNDLAAGQVSLDDLKSRLEQLERVNANMGGATEEQRVRKRQGEVKLKNHQKAVIKVQRVDNFVPHRLKFFLLLFCSRPALFDLNDSFLMIF